MTAVFLSKEKGKVTLDLKKGAKKLGEPILGWMRPRPVTLKFSRGSTRKNKTTI